jgi:predicted Zn-dependent peptidase
MAEAQMMAPAGDVPERTREEMASLRPLGWNIKVGRRATQLSEVATAGQLPGALRQLATRMRGVTVSDAALKTAIATVRQDQSEHLLGSVDNALYFQVGEVAGGASPNAITDLAAAKGLNGVTAKDFERRLHATFVPAGAVLALAGDLGGMDVHGMVESMFAGLPGGAPTQGRPAEPPRPAFRPSFRSLERPDVDRPVGVLAVNAPALGDSAHPRFFLAMLLIGQYCHQTWKASPLVKTRFRYSIHDEPELVRFYPEIARDSTDARTTANELRQAMKELVGMTVLAEEYDALRYNVLWLLGGPMTPPLLSQVRNNGAALNNVCNILAARELTGGEAFWSLYRRRFLVEGDPGLDEWARYVCRPEHQAGLLFAPLKK